jgi:DNA-binding MarR family transcriptional regulator
VPGPSVGVSTLVFRVARLLRTALDQAFAETGLTSQQAGLLLHILSGESSPKQLAGLLGIDGAGMTRMLDRLERKGLVDRGKDPADRRAVHVTLTREGAALAPRLPALFEQVSAGLLGELDVEEATQLLRSLAANLGDVSD